MIGATVLCLFSFRKICLSIFTSNQANISFIPPPPESRTLFHFGMDDVSPEIRQVSSGMDEVIFHTFEVSYGMDEVSFHTHEVSPRMDEDSFHTRGIVCS